MGAQQGRLPDGPESLHLPNTALESDLRAAPSTLVSWLNRGWLLLTGVILMLWVASLSLPAPKSDPGVQWLTHTLVAMPPKGTPAQIGVTLPHSWKDHGWVANGIGRYTSVFTLSQDTAQRADKEPWALRIDCLSDVRTITINGRLLQSTILTSDAVGAPAPALIDLPGGMLHSGQNTLTIEVHSLIQGGLSLPALAAKADLRGSFVLLQALSRAVPLVLNIACVSFSLFVMPLWWHRRQEAAAGLFGLLYMVGAARNIGYFLTDDLGISPSALSLMNLCAHIATACLQGWFVMAFAQRHLRWFSRLLWTILIGAPLIAVATLPVDPLLIYARGIMNPMLIMLILPSMYVLHHKKSAARPNPMLGLTLGVVGVLISGAHDYIYLRLMGHVDSVHWLPWGLPVALPAFSLVILGRMVKALNDVEDLNSGLEFKVAERTRELASANAAKSRFLAAASHDLRQPVAAIGLINELLHERLQDDAARDLSQRMTQAVISMERLLKSLLDLSRLDSGTIDVRPQRVRLQPLLDAIVSHEAEPARRKGLALRVRSTRGVAWTDPVLLEQVLRNLIGNAVNHTTSGGVLVTVRARGQQWLIQVWDTGRGIAPIDQARIFEEFVQLSNPGRDRRQGLGLGLAIAQRAAQLLGHEISLRSNQGRGTCFSLILPRAQVTPPPAPSPTGSADDSWDRVPIDGHVMLVEDEPAIRESLTYLLESWGMTVSAGPDLAWVRCQPEQDWALLISDHRLPDGTGREAILHLRRTHTALPAIIISGDTSPEQLAQLAHSGLPVLHKPFRAEKLRAMINETMALQAKR
jgi:signal transduction histidine kinase/CheY-like chemotaxis protein